MKRWRVLFVCQGHPDLVPGGTEVVSHGLFRAMREDGRVEPFYLGCVSGLHREPRSDTPFQAISRASDEMLIWIGGFDPFLLGHADVGSFASAFGTLLSAFRPDIVHFHHFTRIGLEAVAVIRNRLPRAKIVATLHDYHLVCPNDGLMMTLPENAPCERASLDACHACFPAIPQRRLAARRLHLGNLVGMVDRFISPSRFLRDRYVAWGLPAASIQVIGNALPAAAPVPAAAAPDRPRTRFGFFGNVAPHKGVLVALAASRQLVGSEPPLSLRLHGGMRYQPNSFRDAFFRGLTQAEPVASYAGPYRRGDLPTLMGDVDWVVVPSTWWENAPLVILEAFQQRRPVICSNAGGMAEMVEDEVNGLHARLGDAADLAAVMRRAATEPGLWQRLAANCPRVPTMDEAVDRHLVLYHALLAQQEALSA